MTFEYRMKRTYSGSPSPTNTALLPICIGNVVHEGLKLELALKWIANTFNHAYVIVVDALQRHTISLLENVSPADAQQIALERGRAWLKRYSHLLAQHSLTDQIIYWGDLLKHPDYPTHAQNIDRAYHSSQALRDAVDSDVQAFMQRVERRNPNLDHQRTREACRRYVLEELAAQHQINIRTRGVEVYPNVELQAAQCIRAGLVDSIPSDFVAVGFVRMSYRRVKTPENKEGQKEQPC